MPKVVYYQPIVQPPGAFTTSAPTTPQGWEVLSSTNRQQQPARQTFEPTFPVGRFTTTNTTFGGVDIQSVPVNQIAKRFNPDTLVSPIPRIDPVQGWDGSSIIPNRSARIDRRPDYVLPDGAFTTISTIPNHGWVPYSVDPVRRTISRSPLDQNWTPGAFTTLNGRVSGWESIAVPAVSRAVRQSDGLTQPVFVFTGDPVGWEVGPLTANRGRLARPYADLVSPIVSVASVVAAQGWQPLYPNTARGRIVTQPPGYTLPVGAFTTSGVVTPDPIPSIRIEMEDRPNVLLISTRVSRVEFPPLESII